MATFQITFEQEVNPEVIRAALATLGQFKLTAKRQVKPKAEKEFQEPIIARKPDGSEREINGIEVQQKINKFMSMIAAGHRSDSRTHVDFRNMPIDDNAADYIQEFCSGLNHVKSEYQVNGEIVAA